MSRARELAKLGNPNIFTSDSEGVGIGTNDPKQDFQVGVGFTVSGSAGVATAQSFVGDCSGTTASFVNGTFTGNVSIAKTLTYDDVTNIDSVGLITARNGLQVLAGISTFSGQTNLTNTNVTAGIVTVAGQTLLANANVSAAATAATATVSGQTTLANVNVATGIATVAGQTTLANLIVASGIATVAGQTTLANVNVASGIATVAGQTSLANVIVSAAATTSGKLTVNSGAGFTGFLLEGCNIVGDKLSNKFTINLNHGGVHYFTTAESTTTNPNFTTTAGINTDLAIGETFAVTIVTTAAAAGYSTGARVDAGAVLPVYWAGGSDPSTGASSGLDVYTYQAIKTASATFTILGNLTNFA